MLQYSTSSIYEAILISETHRILETFHSFVSGYAVYWDTVTHWNDAEPNSYPISCTVLAETLITVMVQVP